MEGTDPTEGFRVDKIMFALYDLCGKPTPPPAPLTEIFLVRSLSYEVLRTPLWNHRLPCLGADSNLPSAAFAKG